jgi:hypothetical protein
MEVDWSASKVWAGKPEGDRPRRIWEVNIKVVKRNMVGVYGLDSSGSE